MNTNKIVSSYLKKIRARDKAPQDFIDELNKDLSLEYSAAIQYIQHANMLAGAAEETFAKELIDHAVEEFGHAQKLAERINYIGGTVTMDVGECKTAVTTLGMLTIDLEGEQVAIKRYQERIAQAEKNNDPGTAELIREILIDEEQHENDLVTYMNKKA